MSPILLSVQPGTSLAEIETIFAERDVSAVPVFDDAEKLVGIVSSSDLLRVARVAMSASRIGTHEALHCPSGPKSGPKRKREVAV